MGFELKKTSEKVSGINFIEQIQKSNDFEWDYLL